MSDLRTIGAVCRATHPSWGVRRLNEPVTVGVPLPEGAASDPACLSVVASDGSRPPVQVRSVDRWPDGSIRWALFDLGLDTTDGSAPEDFQLQLSTTPRSTSSSSSPLSVTTEREHVRVDTGIARFEFTVGGPFPFSAVAVAGRPVLRESGAALRVTALGHSHIYRLASAKVQETGPCRVSLEVTGETAGFSSTKLRVTARVDLFVGSAVARLDLTLHNPRRARHNGGQWELGDPGSFLFEEASLAIAPAGPVSRVRCALERGEILTDAAVPVDLLQESSGGAAWDHPAHKNRQHRVPHRFRGYEFREGERERRGHRADPIFEVAAGGAIFNLAFPKFWQNFPRSVHVGAESIEVGLFPRTWCDLHELQGGEQKTHRLFIAFAQDSVSDPPLAWTCDPVVLASVPEWSARSEAVPYAVPERADPNQIFVELANRWLTGPSNFHEKREAADEYGWRNFGDLPADHESAFTNAGQRFVSHYNNQYDALAGFAIQFLRTADARWWELFSDLAWHVRDIDIYRTREDKPAYNGGLFWHTDHYVDAGTSTHRTYPRGGAHGGGPSAEHNYNAGLMWHFFLTGDDASREAAIGLGRWVIDMDDGRQSIFRFIDRRPTGHASFTLDYHGPGRGAGHSILACLVANQLTHSPEFLSKAEALIERCASPSDDIDALDLGNPERRWSYTVFLQAVASYLDLKRERRETDPRFVYASGILLHYARWMAANEAPYLDRPEQLEFPNETWAAQDLRKADVFRRAAIYASPGERERFVERADFFFRYATETLRDSPTGSYVRPLVLLVTNGWRDGWFRTHALPAAPLVSTQGTGTLIRAPFVPQKARVWRMGRRVAVLFALMAVIGTAACFFR